MSGAPNQTYFFGRPAFDQLYAENPDLEEYIDEANDILDRQEELGIISLSCQDVDSPAR